MSLDHTFYQHEQGLRNMGLSTNSRDVRVCRFLEVSLFEEKNWPFSGLLLVGPMLGGQLDSQDPT